MFFEHVFLFRLTNPARQNPGFRVQGCATRSVANNCVCFPVAPSQGTLSSKSLHKRKSKSQTVSDSNCILATSHGNLTNKPAPK